MRSTHLTVADRYPHVVDGLPSQSNDAPAYGSEPTRDQPILQLGRDPHRIVSQDLAFPVLDINVGHVIEQDVLCKQCMQLDRILLLKVHGRTIAQIGSDGHGASFYLVVYGCDHRLVYRACYQEADKEHHACERAGNFPCQAELAPSKSGERLY